MTTHPLLKPLNDAQRRAVTTTEGPVLVLAGPGSGKTRVLTHRIAYMIDDKHIEPRYIMAVTFTNKAAGEMRERVEKLMGGAEAVRGLTLGTFHAICARILRREVEATPYKPNFAIYDTGDQQTLVKNIITEMQKDPKQHRPGAILAAISAAKNELITPDEFPGGSYREEVVREAYRRYMKKLQASNALDFDDLLMQTVLMFRKHVDLLEKYHRYLHYLMVDEFQDTNMAQYELVRLLTLQRKNLFVVGDPDQSIYAFRGADYRNVFRFQQDYPERTVITLDENYRSHQRILDAAMAVIRKDPSHIKRDLYSQRKEGPNIEIHELQSERQEGAFIVDRIRRLMRDEGYTMQDFAVMYRTNAQSRSIEDAFIDANLPYRIVGGIRFYERMEIKDLLAYLRLIHNPDDIISFDRVINTPARGLGKKSLEVFAAAVDQRDQGQWAVLQEVRSSKFNPLTARAARALQEFAELLEKWVLMSQDETVNPLMLLDTVIEDTGYIEYIQTRSGEKDPEDRIENINELRRKMAEFEGYPLSHVLEEISLVADIDSVAEGVDAPILMTLHAAKGLEFPVVFLPGLEEGLLPHERSLNEIAQMSEERRLMYVGITRAKERLYLTHSTIRSAYSGGADYREPSRFLDDLPQEIVMRVSPWQGRTTSYQRSYKWTPTPQVAESARPRFEPRFKTGTVVSHSVFGRGIVIGSKASAEVEEVVVKFEGVGLKKLDGSFLSIISK